jgi:hypothetical protein
MVKEYYIALDSFYIKLRNCLTEYYKKEPKSVFFSLFNVKNNIRTSFLSQSSKAFDDIFKEEYEYLISNGYIVSIGNFEKYIITTKGIWFIETDKDILDIDKLFSFLDEKYLNIQFFGNKPLNDKEKILLMVLIAVRSFSKETAIDLKRSKVVNQKLEELIYDSFDLLTKHGILSKLNRDNLLDYEGNENAVSDFIRHREALVRNSRNIYKTLGGQKYFLDLFTNSILQVKEIGYLIWLIYGDLLNFNNEKELMEFFKKNAYEKCIFLYDAKNFIFINPDYDKMLKNSFKEYHLFKNKNS